MTTLTLSYNENHLQTKKMVDDLLTNGEIETFEFAKAPENFYSEDFEKEWEEGIPVEHARQQLLKKVKLWGLPSMQSSS